MSEKRGFNPLLLVVGLVAGAVGAMAMSDPKIKKKGSGAVKSLVQKLKKIATEAESLNNQKGLDSQRKKTLRPKK